jgi:hypothetical protein
MLWACCKATQIKAWNCGLGTSQGHLSSEAQQTGRVGSPQNRGNLPKVSVTNLYFYLIPCSQINQILPLSLLTNSLFAFFQDLVLFLHKLLEFTRFLPNESQWTHFGLLAVYIFEITYQYRHLINLFFSSVLLKLLANIMYGKIEILLFTYSIHILKGTFK